MGFHWRSIFLFLVISVAILRSSHAHSEPQDYVDAHSCTRTLFELPPLTWDPELAKHAEDWANQRKDCKMIHSGRCGENMAAGPNLNGSFAVQMWMDEKSDFDGEKCVEGTKCTHYTQCIWKDTTRIGCARVKCDPADSPNYLVVCNYDPPGNVPGEKPM